jgi:dUTP pyrophosphatase
MTLLNDILELPKRDQWTILFRLIESLKAEGVYMTTHSFKEHERVVKVMLTTVDARLPVYAKDGDAGADVYAVANDGVSAAGLWELNEKDEFVDGEAGDYLIPPGQTILIDLGFKIELRPGWEMQVRSRSGMAKLGLVVANAPGTIDSGYRGPCMVLLRNNSYAPRIIKAGTRVAQFVLKRAPQAIFEVVKELTLSERGTGGFGSTGTK